MNESQTPRQTKPDLPVAAPAGPHHDEPKTIVEHLDELRTRLLHALAGLVAGALIAFPFQKVWLRLLVHPARGSLTHLTFLSPTEPFIIQLKLALLAGVIIASPYIFWQLWLFTRPALYENERRWVYRLSGASVGLFLIGVLFAYFVMIPIAMKFFMQFQSDFLIDQVTLANYIGFAAFWLLTIGVVFQTPLVLLFLMKTGILPRERLTRNRRVVIVIVLIVAAVFSPPDAVSMMIVAVPLYALFEVSLWIAAASGRIKRRTD